MSTELAGAANPATPYPSTGAHPAARPYEHDGGFDGAMRRLLRVPEQRTKIASKAVYRTFSTGMVLSGLRCLLTYIILPVITPALGLATGVGPYIGIPIAILALVFDVMGIRRFWVADHRYRYAMTAVYLAVMMMVTGLFILDLVHLAH